MKKEHDFYQVSLKLLLKNMKGETLVLKALDNGSYAGYYDLPGGRIDLDEFDADFTEILKREVTEEIGDVTFRVVQKPVAIGRHLIPAPLSSTGKDVHVLYLFFEAVYEGGDIKMSNEHSDHLWLNLKTVDLGHYFTSGILEGIQMYLEKNS